jgi:dTDP-4-dehydrorhamnose reductase
VRVLVTGGSGFVGSNLVHVLAAHGHEVVAPTHAELDLTDARATARRIESTAPDAIVHAAIWNGFGDLLSDRRRAWDSFVGATRNVVDAAESAHVVLVSTDWVFDGTQGPATESEPPNPVNAYGFLKAASELAIHGRGTVARIAGVQGIHRARPRTPREQDAGFGYLVASAVQAIRAGRRFTVWDDPRLNTVATPTLATDAAELILKAIDRRVIGTLHCVGGEHIDRVSLARRAVAAFGLDERLLEVGPPPADAEGPYDTSLDATYTAEALGVELRGVDSLLTELRIQLEEAWSAACTT